MRVWDMNRLFSKRTLHLLAWVMIFTFFMPSPVFITARAVANDDAHVYDRLNSPERAAAIEEAAAAG